jgi:hypothetical protein
MVVEDITEVVAMVVDDIPEMVAVVVLAVTEEVVVVFRQLQIWYRWWGKELRW